MNIIKVPNFFHFSSPGESKVNIRVSWEGDLGDFLSAWKPYRDFEWNTVPVVGSSIIISFKNDDGTEFYLSFVVLSAVYYSGDVLLRVGFEGQVEWGPPTLKNIYSSVR